MKNSQLRIKKNLFFHIHSTKTDLHSLKWNFTFGLGIMSIALFLILTLSGFLLMIYYKPDTAKAYFSIKDLIYVIPSGRFVRNIHRWAAHLMIITCFLHMARVFYTSAYKRGRWFNWNIGLCLLVLTLGLSFTGYLLPWDQLAYWACTIGVNIIATPSQITDAMGISHLFDPGVILKQLFLGANHIGNDTLIRFYVLHCAILPLLMALFIGVHIWRIRKIGGLSRPDNLTSETINTYPQVLFGEFTILIFSLAVVCALAFFFDAPLKAPANALVPENPAKAPWYFLGIQEFVSYSSLTGGFIIPVIILAALSILPYFDREDNHFGVWFTGYKEGRIVICSVWFTLLISVLFLYLSIAFNWPQFWISNKAKWLSDLINPGTLFSLSVILWSSFWFKRGQSGRTGTVAFFTCFFIGTIVFSYFGWTHRGPNWEFYWWPSLWVQ